MDSSTQVQAFDWKNLFFSFEGRIRRTHFWVGWLILLGVGVVVGWIPFIGWLISIALIWPNLAIVVKRLHDMGRSGWLAVIPYAALILGGIIAFFMVGVGALANSAALEAEDPAAIMALIGPIFGFVALIGLICLAFLLWIGITDSQPGDNRFGPNPKGL